MKQDDKVPCFGCPDRTPECHGQCMKYKIFAASREKVRAERQQYQAGRPPKPRYAFKVNHKVGSSGWLNVGHTNARQRERVRAKEGWQHVQAGSRIKRARGGNLPEGIQRVEEES